MWSRLACDDHGNPVACGTLASTDVDNAPNAFTPVCWPEASAGGYGSFTMTAAGVWTYTLDNANCTVDALNSCDTLCDSFTVTTIDGTAQVVKITIYGANDGYDFKASAAGNSFQFNDEISGFGGSNVIDPLDVDFAQAAISQAKDNWRRQREHKRLRNRCQDIPLMIISVSLSNRWRAPSLFMRRTT